MSGAGKAESTRILVVRLGAMGDVLHTLPAVASLKHSHPGSRLTWAIEPKWAPLLEGNPFVDRIFLLHRDSPSALYRSYRELRSEGYDFAVDFQGLIKSALVASASHADRIFGFDNAFLRERLAGVFYSSKTFTDAAHVVDRNLDLAVAAGGSSMLRVFPLPEGVPEGQLPTGDFVLASPLAGWGAKQWPREHYHTLAKRLHEKLGLPLVVNLPPGTDWPKALAIPHVSSLAGLIHATRRAAAVVGVDSGPLHLAAALAKPGVAIFGPTDPARNGPYGNSLQVLRAPGATTTYKRKAIDETMARISPDLVFDALRAVLSERPSAPGCSANCCA
jgi:heptosyltransferase-1